jgi:arsenate reductase-like glutaredoxin family protein
VLTNDEAKSLFKHEGMKAAKRLLAEKNLEYGSRTFKSVKNATEALRQMSREEYYSISENKMQVSSLKELYNELGKIFKELKINL